MRVRLLTTFAVALLLGSTLALVESAPDLRFAVTFSSAQSATPLDGRVLLMISTDGAAEPRFQISGRARHAADLRHRRRRPEAGARRRSSTPRRSAIRSTASRRSRRARTHVQALLHRYETFRRADGHVVKLPMDRGEGQQWTRAPGNLYSTPQQDRDRPAEGRGRSRSRSTRSSRRSPIRRRRSTSSTSAHPERAPDEVLGPADAPRRARPAAPGLRRASRSAVPARHLPRPLPGHVRRVPRRAARPEP